MEFSLLIPIQECKSAAHDESNHIVYICIRHCIQGRLTKRITTRIIQFTRDD